jgi:hypothetical protein
MSIVRAAVIGGCGLVGACHRRDSLRDERANWGRGPLFLDVGRRTAQKKADDEIAGKKALKVLSRGSAVENTVVSLSATFS